MLVFFALWGIPLVAVHRGPPRLLCGLLVVASHIRAWALGHEAFSSCGGTGLAAPRHMESFQTRHQTHVPCIGRQILYRWTTREACNFCILISVYSLNLFISSNGFLVES